MEKVQTERIVSLVLKAVAVGMSIASFVMGLFGVADIDTHLTLLGIGLFTLAVAALQKEGQSGGNIEPGLEETLAQLNSDG
jgi:hypothetical protein